MLFEFRRLYEIGDLLGGTRRASAFFERGKLRDLRVLVVPLDTARAQYLLENIDELALIGIDISYYKPEPVEQRKFRLTLVVGAPLAFFASFAAFPV